MESTKNRKKGLISIVSLIVCLAMLTVGTYAWFTDTATVSGNRIMAGNLDAAIVMTKAELIEKVTGLKAATNEDSDAWDGTGVQPEDATKIKLDAGWTKVTADARFTSLADASPVKAPETDADGSKTYYDVTGMKANLINLGNLEPGQVHPIVMTVANRGELAMGFTAGFRLPLRSQAERDAGKYKYTSYTGLETLELQMLGATDSANPGAWKAAGHDANGLGIGSTFGTFAQSNYDHIKNKLLPKQWAYAPDSDEYKTAANQYTAAKAGLSLDKGGRLEDVLEVYYVTKDEYEQYYLTNLDSEGNPTWKASTAKYFTEPIAAEIYSDNGEVKTPAKPNLHYLGTIKDVVNCTDDGYKTDLDTRITTAQRAVTERENAIKADPLNAGKTADELAAIYAEDVQHQNLTKAKQDLLDEKGRLETAKDKLAKSSSGYCVPQSALDTAGTPLTVKINGIDPLTDISDIGTAVYLIKMSDKADDRYQNAYIELDMGITANQVKWEKDGVNNYLYDEAPNPPAASPDPEPETEVERPTEAP